MGHEIQIYFYNFAFSFFFLGGGGQYSILTCYNLGTELASLSVTLWTPRQLHVH